jgi:hypothetical protein
VRGREAAPEEETARFAEGASPDASPSTPAADRGERSLGPFVLVGVAVAFTAWVMRAEMLTALNPNDSAVHLSMAKWAAERVRDGHLPLDGWYPNLGLGSSLFHHYQSLPHILTGTLGLAIGVDRAFTGMLWLLLVTGPIAVYVGARFFGWDRWVAAGAALVSPLLASTPVYLHERAGYGHEFGSYSWDGLGLWSQLWAMWLLPIALGLSWRAVSRQDPPRYAVAAIVLGLTAALHFLTGYLALLALGVWVLVRPSEFRARLGRAALVGFGAVLAISWVVVPLLLDGRWTSQSEFRQGTSLFDSFGATKVLSWLFTGRLFDAHRAPVITLLVLVGAGVCVSRWRRDERARALLGLMGLSLLLFFGRPTLGPLLNVLPGNDDLLLHRYVLGVHLAGILLAGVGGAWLVRAVVSWLRSRTGDVAPAVRTAAVVLIGACLLAPVVGERWAFGRAAGASIRAQRAVDASEGAALASLVREAQARGPGRIYGGSAVNWGLRERIGRVPIYAALLGLGADGVGFVLRTTSLPSDVEGVFDDSRPEQYELLGIRYIVLRAGTLPRVPATYVDRAGDLTLWEVDTGGYLDVVDTVSPPIEADRTNLLERAAPFIRSDLLRAGRYPTVAFAGDAPAAPTLAEGRLPSGAAGIVEHERADPADGAFEADVVAERPAVVVLRASFDPRWRVTVDGEPVTPQMIAPSLVGAPVPSGRHTVAFRYAPFPRYDALLLVGLLTILALAIGPRLIARGRDRSRSKEPA